MNTSKKSNSIFICQIAERNSRFNYLTFFLGTNRVGFFGGVQDNEDAESEDSDDEDGTAGNFFNDILSVNIENERATWTKIELTGKKDAAVKKRKKDGSPKDGVIVHDFIYIFLFVINCI